MRPSRALRSASDVEAVLPRVAVTGPAQSDRDLPQAAVVHVDHALPEDAADVDVQRVPVVDVVVNGSGKQVVRQGNGGEVSREVQVDLLHGDHLRIPAASGAALHAEHGPEAGLAQGDHGLPADMVQRVAQAHRGGGLAFASRRRADGSHEHELAVGPIAQRVQIPDVDLGLVVAIGNQVGVGDAQTLMGQFGDAPQPRALGYLDVAQRHGRTPGKYRLAHCVQRWIATSRRGFRGATRAMNRF
jgi:hypothetical protein